uniref:Putative cuticle collagen 75 (inferred by orthology to a C. elegans protein) n=1 Tax=Strongyloides venezuelensis TaxID=75913 RepID=A0A0K0FYZ1_STRVS
MKECNKLSCIQRLSISACFFIILFHISYLRFIINKLKHIEYLSKNGLKKFKELDDGFKDQFNDYYLVKKDYIIRLRRELSSKCECKSSNFCPRGPPGIKGSDGIPGFSGEKGSSGEPGKPFLEVITTTKKIFEGCRKCFVGPQGLPGENGLPGPQGFPGIQGLQGIEGKPGEMGSAGNIGEQGSIGVSGITGEKGLKGTDGIRSLPGQCGLPGSKGQVGQKGEPGYPGRCGKPGSPGEKGKTGPPGMVGIPGMMGQHGLPGIMGEVGFDGGYCKCQSVNRRKTDEKEEYDQKQPYVKDETFTDHPPISIGIEAKIKNIKIGKTTKKAIKFLKTDDDKRHALY